ncbi:hypothetical protein RvY_16085 [Ramazzottius varieornatus]|uniref:Uncharacterized protein n=1 Tax=Ramazzottius varieornatus TaxID=947166 RepID=A0A1D1VYK5_RAMVA|nr:hypothetical protein RvY_16085 [Ramazzottius varieornatus]
MLASGPSRGPSTLLLALGAVIALFSMTIAFGVLWGQEKARNEELMSSTSREPAVTAQPVVTTTPGSHSPGVCTTPACVAAAVKTDHHGRPKIRQLAGYIHNGITPNISEPRQNVIEFDAGRFTLDRSVLLNESKVEVHNAYVEYMTEVALEIQKRLGNSNAALNVDIYRRIFQDVLRFEKALASFTLPSEKRRDEWEMWHEMRLDRFAETYFNPTNNGEPLALHIYAKEWVNYFRTAWGASAGGITEDTVSVVREPAYYGNLTTALAGIEFSTGTANRVTEAVGGHLLISVVEPFVRQIDDEFLAIYQRFPNAVGSLYAKNFFHPQAKKDGSDWMTPATRLKTLEKAKKLISSIAYDEYLMSNDNTALNAEHESFKPDRNNTYFLNYAKGRDFETQVEGQMLVKGNKRTGWITGPAIVNAFYSPNHNSISLPAGILQSPFMGQGYPWYWNFAAIGTDKEFKDAFKPRAQTIIDQYSNYSLMGVQLKGENNQGENIADNVGLKESYRVQGYTGSGCSD